MTWRLSLTPRQDASLLALLETIIHLIDLLLMISTRFLCQLHRIQVTTFHRARIYLALLPMIAMIWEQI